jgi:hypothetical protein
MDDQRPFAPGGDEGETEAVHPPHRDEDPPTGGRTLPAVWLLLLGLVTLMLLGLLVGWGFGMLDSTP